MNDKYQELLDQYDIEVFNTFRSKGTFQCETNQGLAILKEYHGSLHCLAREYEWKEALYKEGFPATDRCFVSKEESLVVYDRYHTPFVLMHYYRGRECDCTLKRDVYEACRNLAALHQVSLRIPKLPIESLRTEPIDSLFLRRNRELRKIRAYVSRVSRKKNFELLYIKHFSSFYEEAEAALAALNQMEMRGLETATGICHGAYQHHNVLFLPDGSLATVGFESICYQPLLIDLYLFLRKTMEKNQYDFSYFETGIAGYNSLRPLASNDLHFLYFLFLYPEKFWKISNRYNNHRKSWISPKMEEKLLKLLDQNSRRRLFLDRLRESYLQQKTS